jgi:hypothetical protein
VIACCLIKCAKGFYFYLLLKIFSILFDVRLNSFPLIKNICFSIPSSCLQPLSHAAAYCFDNKKLGVLMIANLVSFDR